MKFRVILLIGFGWLPGGTAFAQTIAANLADLSLEQLSNIEVTSVSRRAESLSDAAASIYVISAEDIRRSGAKTLPEALRLAPNLQVARADTNQYAITARGFNSVLANKMLVMIDGRIVYSPLFSGVFWEAQDVMLEDVLRIEVISGPGATQFGSNAVNGVINVLTRPANETQGALATASIGKRQRDAALRYGGELESGGHYRVYGKFSDRGGSVLTNGAPVGDASDIAQVGFRTDWSRTGNELTLQGDAYRSDIDQVPGSARKISGMNLNARWNRALSDTSGMRLQVYFDRTERDQPGTIRETLDTLHGDFQHRSTPREGHLLLWGADIRRSWDTIENVNPAALGFRPASRNLTWASAFVQDAISLLEHLVLTLGIKAERNDYTGTELLPSARLAWKAAPNHLLWSALSRAVRAPSRVDREFFIPANPPFLLAGGPNFRSEVVNVFEVGYRAQYSTRLSYSVSAYRQSYDKLRTTELQPGGAVFANNITGHVDGVEAWGNLRMSDTWRLSAGQVFQSKKLGLKPGSTDTAGLAALGTDPEHWTTLRTSHDFGSGHELDVMARHIGQLANGPVPAYTAVDVRWGWMARKDLELSLTGQNLFDRRHVEWGSAVNRAEMERGFYLKAAWRL
jgi:iron complex outermembrane receptor protein